MNLHQNFGINLCNIKITQVVSVRPGFIKIDPLIRVINTFNQQIPIKEQSFVTSVLVSTGQPYDDRIYKFF
jgi:UDP-N-acetylglucosamine 2-epimerase